MWWTFGYAWLDHVPFIPIGFLRSNSVFVAWYWWSLYSYIYPYGIHPCNLLLLSHSLLPLLYSNYWTPWYKKTQYKKYLFPQYPSLKSQDCLINYIVHRYNPYPIIMNLLILLRSHIITHTPSLRWPPSFLSGIIPTIEQ